MKLKKNRAGMALISVLLLTVMLSMLTVSMVFISTNHAGMMGNAEQQMNALKAAEGMAEYALCQLNKDLNWSPTSSSPSLDFGKAKAYLYFTSASTEYLSYNNLKGKDPVTRSGNDKLAGQKVPAFTAELICKGTCGNAVKYLKVIYLRNDIYSYPVIADGKIVIDGGNVKIYGDYTDANNPGGGNIHSNWIGSGPSIERVSSTCAIDAKGGVASAAGKIEGMDPNTDPNVNVTIRENLENDGKLPVDEINPSDIISKHITEKAVSPGTYLISPLYYIPNDQAVMKEILEKARAKTTLSQEMKDYSLTKVPTPTSLSEAVNMGNVNTSGWKSTNGYNVNYNVAITTVEGVTYDAREGVIPEAELGWDKIRVASITTTRTITVSGTEEHTHGIWPFKWKSEDPTSGAGTTVQTIAVDPGLLEFKLSPYNGSFEEYQPPEWLTETINGQKALLESEPLGLAKLEGSGKNFTTTDYLPIDVDKKKGTNYTSDELGLKTTATTTAGEKNSVDVELGFELTDDIYISGTPGANDYKVPLDDLVGTSKSPKIENNIFRIMGFTYQDKIGGKTYNLNTKFNLNDKNIYSGSHVVLGTEVSGKGSIISKGKIAYVYDGINSNEILSISDDDLYIQTTKHGEYNVNGYLYSSDDVCIEDFKEGGALAGAIKSDGTGVPGDMFIKGTLLGMNSHKDTDGDANNNDSISIKGERDKIFIHDSSGWRRLADVRPDGFSVRIGSWFELN